MACPCTKPDTQALDLAKCAGYAPRAIDASDVTSYAHRSGATKPNELCYVQACLWAGRMIYWKNTPGDCPKQTALKLGPVSSLSKGIGIGEAGLGAASSVSLFATGGAGVGASAGGAGTALGGLPAIFGAVAGVAAVVAIPLAVWGAISAHHKIAVAREQADLCDVSQAFNQYAATIEAGIISGQISVSDAKTAISTVESQLVQSLKIIYKKCNAACINQFALIALDLYATEKWYDVLGTQVASSTGSLFGSSSQPGKISGIATLGIGGAVALAAAHYA